MTRTFQVDIVTPTQVISIGQVEYLRAPSSNGLFGIKAKHTPAIINMEEGEIKILKDGKESYYATSGGFADIKSEGVLLLVETIELSNEIDKQRAEKSLKRAKKFISDSNSNLKRAEKSLKRAQNRLKISNR